MIRYSLTETAEERNFQLPPPSSPRPYLECNIKRRGRKGGEIATLPASSGLVVRGVRCSDTGARKRERKKRREQKPAGARKKRRVSEIAPLERDDAASEWVCMGPSMWVGECMCARTDAHTRTGLILWPNYTGGKIIQSPRARYWLRSRARTGLLSADPETTIGKEYRLSLSAFDTRDNHVKNKSVAPSSSSREIDPSAVCSSPRLTSRRTRDKLFTRDGCLRSFLRVSFRRRCDASDLCTFETEFKAR